VKTEKGDRVEIELLNEDHGSRDGSDVEFSSGPRRRGPWLLAVLVVVGLLAVAATRTGTRHKVAAVPSTAIPPATASATSTTAFVPTTARSDVPVPFHPNGGLRSSETILVGPALPLGHKTATFLYLTPASGAPTSVQIYDIDTGGLRQLDLGTDVGWYVRAIDMAGGVVVDGGAVVRVEETGVKTVGSSEEISGAAAPFGRVANARDGGVWVRDVALGKLQLMGRDGQRGIEYDLPLGADLYGSMSDGRPVVRGADQRSYVIDKAGTRSLLSSGLTSYVEHGKFTETTCDDQQNCVTVGHFDTQKRAILLSPKSMVRFDPGGPMIAIVQEGETLTLLNGVTGDVIPVVMSGHIPFDPTFPLATNVTFLPDGQGLIATTSTGHVLIDQNGAFVTNLPLGLMGSSVLGTGHGLAAA
jgi:hypothetical protein